MVLTRGFMDEAARRELLLASVESHYPADALRSPEAVGAWFAAQGLIASGAPVTAEDVQLARHLRGALRSLFRAHNGGDLQIEVRTAAAIEAVMESAPLAV